MLTRRNFLQVLGAGTAVGVAGGLGWGEQAARADAVGSRPSASPPLPAEISHVVLLMLENRSFDHLLGWLPGADGRTDLVFRAPNGNAYRNYPLAPDFQGCGYSDADHSWEGWLVENDNSQLDGFLQRPGKAPSTPGVTPAAVNTFPIGYYTNLGADGTPKAVPDLPVLGALAQHYTVVDRYFAGIAAETYPNRFYQHAARTDRDHNSSATSKLPAIWDQLWPAGMAGNVAGRPTGAYYYQDLPFLALWGTKYLSFVRPYSASTGNIPPGLGLPPRFPGTTFLDAVKAGALPNVSYVDPSFLDEGSGTSGDDHPLADIRVGERLIADVYHALANSGYLDSTVLVVTFDEWGGFYDHVPPPLVTDDTDPATVDHSGNARPAGFPGPNHPDYRQLGFRVPCIVVSNHAAARVVGGGPFEHTSTLALIESLFGLSPMTARDANAANLGSVLTATGRTDDPSSSIPTSDQVPGPPSGALAACGPTSTQSVPPPPVAPAVVPESPWSAALPAALAVGAGAAAVSVAHRRRLPAATGAEAGEGIG